MGSGLRYLRGALPWPVLVASASTAVVLLAMAAWRPAVTWPLHGAAIGLVLGASAWSADERCAPVVDVAPRSVRWGTAWRLVGPTALGVLWVMLHLVLARHLPPHPRVLVLQGLAAAALGYGVGTWRRRHRRVDGGQRFAMAVVPLVIGVALAGRVVGDLPLFPVWPGDDWALATWIWTLGAIGGIAATVAVLVADQGGPVRS